ncbi:MAG TPA: peptide-methionine (S)-S-oxide reductase MsrA [Allosphingosinicella sp.]|jgi:peptide-methionine (S)-S-oxide reductase
MKIGLSTAAGGAALAVMLYASGLQPAAQAQAAVTIPAPAADANERGTSAVAVFAGGCFWGIEGVFEHVAGVRSVASGYAGGAAGDARYDSVSAGRTNHAEAVRIVYDPRAVSYGRLLQIFFSVAHDPTQLNRQGPDSGRQYRSAIFPQNAEQRRVASAYIAQLTQARRFRSRIVTALEGGGFFPAEAYHQDFMRRNPRHPYIVAHDAPKVRDLRATFPRLVSNRPSA